MQARARANEKISWSLDKTPVEVVIDEIGVTGLRVLINSTGKEEVIQTNGIFVAIGHRPNTSFLSGQINTDDNGYILTKPGTTETNIPGVFACGDVQDRRYRQAITAAGSGSMAAIDSEKFMESLEI